MQENTPSAPQWSPYTARIGRLLFGATRAITGEWSVNGKARRLYAFRGKNGWHFHVIVGAWCFSAGVIE